MTSVKMISWAEAEQRARELVARMSFDEKMEFIRGNRFSTRPIPQHNLPEIRMRDASMGLRLLKTDVEEGHDLTTAFPSSVALAATWNPERAAATGRAIAEEYRACGVPVLLGPGINIYRFPACGRNYEYMGEDPYLITQMVVPYIKAVQELGIMATIKHFAANNCEKDRKNVNSVVDERTLREIYLPGFEAAIKDADVAAVMTAYNLLNGYYCGENAWLIKDVLRKEWGFEGIVMSDWTSIWNADLSINSGLDLEMPVGETLTPEAARSLIDSGHSSGAEIDSKVMHCAKAFYRMAILDGEHDRTGFSFGDAEHRQKALETAREGIVLLKNDALLPIAPGAGKIIVIGPNADPTPTSAGGSGHVRPIEPISIYAAMKSIYPDAEHMQELNQAAVAAADAVVVCVGFNHETEAEAKDRTFELPEGQDELIENCAAANANTIVMIVAGGGIAMPWAERAKAILHLFYPGANGCQAAAEIVAGIVNPSGKLPISIERRIEDNSAFGRFVAAADAPVKKAGVRDYKDIEYSEGIFVGYRHLDAKKIEPLFAFGHGLSYTTFELSDLSITPASGDGKQVVVRCRVKNTGEREGAEVVQLYVGDPQASVPRPPKELKGFQKVFLKAGEIKDVELTLGRRAFSFWDPATKDWKAEPGTFDILLGVSSRDIRLQGKYELQ